MTVTAEGLSDLVRAVLGAADTPQARILAETGLGDMVGMPARLSLDASVAYQCGVIPLVAADGRPVAGLRFVGVRDDGWLDTSGVRSLLPALGAALGEVIRREALARDAARYEDFAAIASDWLWETDKAHRFTSFANWRDARLRLDGLELIGRTRWELPQAEPAAGSWADHRAVLDSHRPFSGFRYSMFDTSGKRRKFRVAGRPLFDRDGQFTGYRGTAADITARDRAESARREALRRLRASDERLRRFIESSADIVCLTDREGHIVEISPRVFDVWGYTPGELIGRRFVELMHPDDREASLRGRIAIISGGRSGQFENRYLHKNGRIVHMHWSSTWSSAEELCFSIARDVTARHDEEQRQRHAQRIEAIGQLTGSVAHDFNNLLTVILGNAELLVDCLPEQENLRPLAEMIQAAATRGADLTSSLLAFARRQALQPRDIDSGALLRRLSGMLQRLLGERVRIDMTLPPDLWSTRVDPAQLETAIVNLGINARDAMPNGGVLVIEAANVAITHKASGGITPGEWLLIQIADTGLGMSEDVAALAFEPFFTTKEVGQGSGLGLSMVHGFVKQSGGHVQIQSEPAAGTIVRLFLPRGGKPLLPEAEDSGPMPRGMERVLLVEDDAFVRANATALLCELGYRVTVATNGLEALTILEGDLPFDLLFTDAVMPGGVDGIALAGAAARLRPQLPILLTTGYVDLTERTDLPVFHNFLRKPYRRHELAIRVRAALDQGRFHRIPIRNSEG